MDRVGVALKAQFNTSTSKKMYPESTISEEIVSLVVPKICFYGERDSKNLGILVTDYL